MEKLHQDPSVLIIPYCLIYLSVQTRPQSATVAPSLSCLSDTSSRCFTVRGQGAEKPIPPRLIGLRIIPLGILSM